MELLILLLGKCKHITFPNPATDFYQRLEAAIPNEKPEGYGQEEWEEIIILKGKVEQVAEHVGLTKPE
jgi:hypothetical protein